MPQLFDPSEVHELGGPTPDQLRDWRRRGFLENMGARQGNGRWKYRWHELTRLGTAMILVRDGFDIFPAIRLCTLADPFDHLVRGTVADNERWEDFRKRNRWVVGTRADSWPGGLKVEGYESLKQLEFVGFGRFCYVVDTEAVAAVFPKALWLAALAAYLAGPQE